MKIWHVAAAKHSELLLYRINSAIFRFVRFGEYSPILTNANYILINKKYRSVFDKLQVRIVDVSVYDNVREVTSDEYLELIIENEITPTSITLMDNRDISIRRYSGDHLFVSDEIKNELERLYKDDFEFTEGFSHFAGAAE